MSDSCTTTSRRWPKWLVVLQAVSVLFALPGATLMLVSGNTGPGMLLLVGGILFLVALVGSAICSKR